MSVNDHIEKYLGHYLQIPNPGFAVLLKGEWGCGKTWFIKNFIKKADKSEKRFLYISLYGIKTISEIDDLIFQQLHPILGSKAVTLLGSVLKGAIRLGVPLELSGDQKNDATLNAQLKGFKIQDIIGKNFKNKVLIFDDLERSNLEIDQVLGYINNFIEHDGLHVILIANEDEIDKKYTDDQRNRYRLIKEKVIGRTFHVNYDLDSALNLFIDNIKEEQLRIFLEKRKQIIKEIFNKAGYNNLRHLQQSLWDFESFYRELTSKFQENEDLIEGLFRVHFPLSIEIKKGEIISEDIKKIGTRLLRYFRKSISKKDEDEKAEKIDQICDKYNIDEIILPAEFWYQLFDKGFVSSDQIQSSLNNSSFFRDETTEDWVKLWHFMDLEDEEIERLLKEIERKWKNREYKDPGIILHLVGIFLHLSTESLYPKSKEEIITEAKEYIDSLKEEGTLKAYYKSEFFRTPYKEYWGGLGFYSRDDEEFEQIKQYLLQKIRESYWEDLPQKAEELLNLLLEDLDEFLNKIIFSNDSEENYINIPIFAYMDPQEFYNKFLCLKNSEKRKLINNIKERYHALTIKSDLLKEKQFWSRVRNIISSNIEKSKKSVTYLILKYFKKTIDEILEKFDK